MIRATVFHDDFANDAKVMFLTCNGMSAVLRIPNREICALPREEDLWRYLWARLLVTSWLFTKAPLLALTPDSPAAKVTATTPPADALGRK